MRNLRRQSKNVQPLSPQSPDTKDLWGGRLGTHLVVDHGPGALVVPLVDCLVGIDQLHLHLLHHCSSQAAVNSTVPAPLRLVESPFADNVLKSHEKWMECTWKEQFAGVSALAPIKRKRMEKKQRAILTPIGDWC